jgi:ADP-heptose:LPS heptosyltransferase
MKILVISLAGIGDTLIATPFIHEARLQFPDAEIDAVVLWAGSLDLLEGNPHLNRIFQKNLIQASKFEAFSFLSMLRARRYDLSVNIHPQSRVQYRMIARLINARERLSHEYERPSRLDRWLVNRSIPQSYEQHSVFNNAALLGLLGRKPIQTAPALEVFLSEADTRWAEEFVARAGLGALQRVGFHVGSGGTKNLPLKRWPLERHLELIRLLIDRHPTVAVLLFGGPQERADHQTIRQAIDDPRVVVVESQGLKQAAALMKRCRAFVSVDTALMHLAAAVGAPNQIVIEAPTLNKTNLPFRPDYTVVRNPMVNGRNLDYYRYDGRDIQGGREHLIECMRSIRAEDVYAVLKERLS